MQSEDWIQFMLDLPMAEAPGSRFEYCNGVSFLLSAIIQQTTGMSALAFAEEHLFSPLGISDVVWPSNPEGITIGWGELRMKPHDMAKIGYLYLNGGSWDGKQVVPASWVKASTRKHVSATLEDGYGYQWWVDASGIYMALGYAGQFIFVVPEKDMIVVFVSDLEEQDFYVPQRLLNDFIIPAAESSTPLPDNPDGMTLLESRLKALAAPPVSLAETVPSPTATKTALPPTVTPVPPTETPSPTDTPGPTATSKPTTLPLTPSATSKEVRDLRITIVYDNNAYDPRLRTAWGFAAFVEYGDHVLLFDTGGDSDTLLDNMAKLDLDPQRVEAVVLSHIHGDHTGGLQGLLDTGASPTVYVPAAFPAAFKEGVRARTDLVEVSGPLEILPGVHSTGPLGALIVEQALVIETRKGIVVITGCAHPGIVRMVRQARKVVKDRVALAMGGFHLGSSNQSQIERVITDFRQLDVKQVSPTHCTGEKAIAMFAAEYGDDYIQGGAGRVIVIGSEPPANPEPKSTEPGQ